MAIEETKPQKVAAPKKRATFSHPTYQEMINDAILALKERNGSSQYAIARFVEEKQKELPPTFRKKLLFSLKSLVKSGKLVKVKGSFKLPSSSAKPEKKPAALAKAKPKPKPNAKAAASPAKPKPKPKVVAAAVVKPKAAPARPKPKERPAKAARTSARTSPGKKPAVAPKKSPAKTAKSKSVKTPTKKVLPRKAKK